MVHCLTKKHILSLSILLTLEIGAAEIDFARDIQPIFAENCTTCHGPDKQKAGLNLTDERSARAELKSGKRAVVNGDPDGSELIYRVTTDDADDLMPPPDHGKRLKPAQIDRKSVV